MVFKAEGRAQCLSVLARTNLNAKRVFYNRPLTIRAYSGIANSIIGGGGRVILIYSCLQTSLLRRAIGLRPLEY